ncbi:fibronectin type III domain-containing protein [Kribbella sp. CA-293567]|uniref:fibronectin type III domain-containing protein n=1 Tax=Kribbella sp. CA-293567 TaxID=3002436 RepID=UPI0022DD93EF|nr:fibronectin type III domain-containing protein [Kribbella sp. CA-293567]WBQ02721.1 fibronectin type III domain-containing protein [Kribbella sp. CA-293567]
MKKLVLAVVTAAAVLGAALIPSGPPVEAATSGFASAVSAIKQLSWQTNSSVNALAVTGNTVYAGGLFTRIRQPGKPAGQGEAARTYIAAFNRTTGAPLAFAPKLNGAVWSIATSPDGNWVVIGGDFTTVNGIKRNRIAMFSVKTGKLVQAWDPSVSTRVKAIAIFGNSVFFGGSFGRVDNVTRNHLAAVRLIQGDLLPWNPNADDEVYAIDLSDNGTRVFVGGPFRRINNKDHYSLAMTNNTTGAAYTMPAAAAIPKPTATCTTRVKDIDTLGNKVFVANGGDGGGCYDGVLAADATTGQLLWKNNCLGATEAIKAIGNWVYKGSHAHSCPGAFPDGTGTHYLLVESAINGNIGPWFPNTDANQSSTTKVGPLAFASGGNDLWVGGDFVHVNGKIQQGLTRFTNAAGGAAPAAPKVPAVSRAVTNQIAVHFKDSYDLDNLSLTYNVFRGATNISSQKLTTYYWQPRKTIIVVDKGVKKGQTVSYHIEIHDGRNIMKGPAVTVKVP